MTKHTCDKCPSCVDFWWNDEYGSKPGFMFQTSSRTRDNRTGEYTSVGVSLTIHVDYCPWCGKKLVRDDD